MKPRIMYIECKPDALAGPAPDGVFVSAVAVGTVDHGIVGKGARGEGQLAVPTQRRQTDGGPFQIGEVDRLGFFGEEMIG